jgi:hypothetical protein
LELRSRWRRRLWASGIHRRAVPGLWGDSQARIWAVLTCRAGDVGFRRRPWRGSRKMVRKRHSGLRIFTGECCVGLRF